MHARFVVADAPGYNPGMYSASTSTAAANELRAMHGTDFERAVGRLLARAVVGFQDVPSKPSGDGGLDGLSHDQQVAYCCYGLTSESLLNKTGRKLKTDVAKKFKGDLRRLFELEVVKGNLVHAPNAQLAAILTSPKKIKCIYLVCNWFESHELIGAMNKAKSEYHEVSNHNYVAEECTIVVEGPKQLCDRVSPDANSLIDLQGPRLTALLAVDGAGPRASVNATDFHEKFDALRDAVPSAKQDGVERMRERYLDDWVGFIAIMRKFDAEMPQIHAALTEARSQAVLEADTASLNATTADAHALLRQVESRIIAEVEHAIPGGLSATDARRFTSRLIGSLLGECPLDWRS